jgi:hypothetical protein
VPEYRKVLLKYSLFGCGTCKSFDVADFKPQGQFSLILLKIDTNEPFSIIFVVTVDICFNFFSN